MLLSRVNLRWVAISTSKSDYTNGKRYENENYRSIDLYSEDQNGQAFYFGKGWWYKTKNAMLVKVTTDEGIEGWGEAYGPAEITKSVVDTLLAPTVVGGNPFDTDILWEKMYQR